MLKGKLLGMVLVCSAGSVSYGAAQLFPPPTANVQLQPIASGLVAPVDLTSAPDGSNRLFVTDQAGQVRIINNGVLSPTPFIDLKSSMVTLMPGYDERGLLGFAFDPNYNNSALPGFHTVYTYSNQPVNGPATFTEPLAAGQSFDNQVVVQSWTVDPNNPNAVLPSSGKTLFKIDHPQFTHEAGHMAFGTDGNLYISEGDGGNANDAGPGHNPTTGNAQDTSVALGKMLRIDVHGNNSANGQYGIPADNPFAGQSGKVQEIFAYGLRNPYRWSFDRGTGQLVLADVGQNNIEEVDKIVKGGNYGWHIKEGTYTFDPVTGKVIADSPGSPAGLIDPVSEYDHTQGIAIIGGYVYRGTRIPSLAGQYIFGDLSTSFGKPDGHLFFSSLTGDPESNIHPLLINGTTNVGLYIKGMGEDANGELYVLASTALGPSGTTGQVFEIVPTPEPATLGLLALCSGFLLVRRRHA